MVTVKTNNPCHHHSNLYLFLSLSFLICVFFSFDASFLPFIFLSLFYLFPQFLNISKTHFDSEEVLFSIKNEISKLLNPLKLLGFIPFPTFLSSCQIYQNLPFLHILKYIIIFINIIMYIKLLLNVLFTSDRPPKIKNTSSNLVWSYFLIFDLYNFLKGQRMWKWLLGYNEN